MGNKAARSRRKAQGFQQKAASDETAIRIQADQMVLEAALARFCQTYPSTNSEDWRALLASESLVMLRQASRLPLYDSLMRQLIEVDEQRQQRGMPAMFSTGLACNDVDRLHQILKAVVEFVDTFYLVFEIDWDYTKHCIVQAVELAEGGQEDFWFGDNGTFANPTIADTSSNWWNRGHLLSSYYKLRDLVSELEQSLLHEQSQEE